MDALNRLAGCVVGVEVHPPAAEGARERAADFLRGKGVAPREARRLAETWVRTDDFLTGVLPPAFDFVVGNPPYLRQEKISEALLVEYRRRYRTLYDRADLYVPFIERSLTLLGSGGRLAFICADRWMKNRYGGPLRSLVASGFHLRHVVPTGRLNAFETEVDAYPAIFVVENGWPARPITRIARPPVSLADLRETAAAMSDEAALSPAFREMHGVVSDDQPWLIEDDEALARIRRMEREFPTLEDADCRVGIGVATGADRIFIGPLDQLDVESERKLPLARTRDIASGKLVWRGDEVVNPFEPDGSLADLARYPRFRRWAEAHEATLRARHVGARSGAGWYRTIDRIDHSLLARPKLLIPDIKGGAHIVHDDGRYYPHHNLYHVTSATWDLCALQAVLQSDVTVELIQAYSTAMRGGFLRFQAQYLRRLRLPRWGDVSASVRARLSDAGRTGDRAAGEMATRELFGTAADASAAA